MDTRPLLEHSRSILNLYAVDDTLLHPLLLSICIRITGLPSLVYDLEVLPFPNQN